MVLFSIINYQTSKIFKWYFYHLSKVSQVQILFELVFFTLLLMVKGFFYIVLFSSPKSLKSHRVSDGTSNPSKVSSKVKYFQAIKSHDSSLVSDGYFLIKPNVFFEMVLFSPIKDFQMVFLSSLRSIKSPKFLERYFYVSNVSTVQRFQMVLHQSKVSKSKVFFR